MKFYNIRKSVGTFVTSVEETSSRASTFENRRQSSSRQKRRYCQRDDLITHDSMMQIHLTLAACDWPLGTYGPHFLSVIVVNNSDGCLADGLAGISSVLIAR